MSTHFPWQPTILPVDTSPIFHPSRFAIPGDPSMGDDVYLYYDAKRWFALMDEYEEIFASDGDFDPWRTAFLDARLTTFLVYIVEKRNYADLEYPAAVERIYKLEKDLIDAAFFNIEKSRRDAEVVLDNNLRAILRSQVDEILRDITWYARNGSGSAERKRKRGPGE